MGSLIKKLPRIEEHDWRCMLKERPHPLVAPLE
jgi:hypothetical protein